MLSLGNELLQSLYVFVIDLFGFLCAELADLTSSHAAASSVIHSHWLVLLSFSVGAECRQSRLLLPDAKAGKSRSSLLERNIVILQSLESFRYPCRLTLLRCLLERLFLRRRLEGLFLRESALGCLLVKALLALTAEALLAVAAVVLAAAKSLAAKTALSG